MSFGGRSAAKRSDEPSFQMAPMIDIVFMLLIFFLVATSFQKFESKLDADLPQQEEQDPEEEPPRQVIVKVTASGLLVNDVPKKKMQFFREMRRLIDYDPNQFIFIDGSDDAYHEDVIEIFDECNRMGVDVTIIPPAKKK